MALIEDGALLGARQPAMGNSGCQRLDRSMIEAGMSMMTNV